METKAYYSRSKFLQFPAGKAYRALENGISVVIDPPYVQFQPYGSDDWGRFLTDDPKVVEHIEARRKRQIEEGSSPDVLTPEEYSAAILPMEMKMQGLESENARLLRMIEDRNALITKLESEGKLRK